MLEVISFSFWTKIHIPSSVSLWNNHRSYSYSFSTSSISTSSAEDYTSRGLIISTHHHQYTLYISHKLISTCYCDSLGSLTLFRFKLFLREILLFWREKEDVLSKNFFTTGRVQVTPLALPRRPGRSECPRPEGTSQLERPLLYIPPRTIRHSIIVPLPLLIYTSFAAMVNN